MRPDIDIEGLIALSRKAGEEILEVYQQDFEVERKADDSPLTEADRRSNKVLVEGLKAAYPDIPIISEENKLAGYAERKQWEYYWLIDPLDGTKEFVKKNGEFTVNVALIKGQEPILGVVHVPVSKLTYYGDDRNGSYRVDAQGQQTPLSMDGEKPYTDKNKVKVVASRSHLTEAVSAFVEELKEQGKEVELISAGSSLKFCLVAEGKADVYPRFGPTMEWDTAAAHAVAGFAGRKILQAETRQPLIYNKEDLLNPWFIVY